MSRRILPPSARRLLSAAFMLTAVAVPLTGCIGLIPNSNTQVAQQKVSESHAVVYTVEAPFGSEVTYTEGPDTLTGIADNFGHWTQTADVKGISKVTISVTSADGEKPATCSITVDGTVVSTGMSVPGATDTAQCSGSTSKS